MGKYGWTHEAELLQTHQWIKYSTWIRILTSFKFLPFSVKAQRDFIRTTLQNLAGDPPFSFETRFPDAGIYIDLSHSVPHNLVRNLILSLDVSDRQAEKERSETDHQKNRLLSNLEDARVAFYRNLYQLLDLGGSFAIEDLHSYGIYIRSSFEDKHLLKWTD